MTAWTDLDARMDAAAFRSFGIDAVLQPAGGGAAVNVRAIFAADAQRIGEGGYVEERPEIQVSRTEVAQPAKGDRYTIGGETWEVDNYEPRGGRWLLVVRKA